MQEIGKVVKIKKDMAIVRVDRKSACATCGMCAIKPNALHVDMRLKNVLDAKIDDKVEIDISTGSVAKMSMLVYILPLVPAFFLFLVSYWFNLSELLSALAFFVGLAVGIVIIVLLDKKIYQKEKKRPKMIKILKEINTNSEEK